MQKIIYTFFLIAGIVFVGCAPSPRYLPRGRAIQIAKKKKVSEKSTISAQKIPTDGSLYGTINLYLGTPYKYGGTGKKGIDCSGFVQKVFSEALDINLPRTVAQQWKFGRAIGNDELAFSDLVFFRTTRKKTPSHIGIYIGGNKFAHASSSLGVTITPMTDSYWSKRYIGARRVIKR
ncbi:C40 family peptidase [bacterium]|nr:C40 family peptidase [bacterium]